jgi:hypothetical protein
MVEPKENALSENDVERIAITLEQRLLKHFYLNLGRGVFGLMWRGIILIMLALAAYGQFHGK